MVLAISLGSNHKLAKEWSLVHCCLRRNYERREPLSQYPEEEVERDSQEQVDFCRLVSTMGELNLRCFHQRLAANVSLFPPDSSECPRRRKGLGDCLPWLEKDYYCEIDIDSDNMTDASFHDHQTS